MRAHGTCAIKGRGAKRCAANGAWLRGRGGLARERESERAPRDRAGRPQAAEKKKQNGPKSSFMLNSARGPWKKTFSSMVFWHDTDEKTATAYTVVEEGGEGGLLFVWQGHCPPSLLF